MTDLAASIIGTGTRNNVCDVIDAVSALADILSVEGYDVPELHTAVPMPLGTWPSDLERPSDVGLWLETCWLKGRIDEDDMLDALLELDEWVRAHTVMPIRTVPRGD